MVSYRMAWYGMVRYGMVARGSLTLIRRGVNVLKRIRHVLLEEISIRERLKVSAFFFLGGRIWISL